MVLRVHLLSIEQSEAMSATKEYWEEIYSSKKLEEVGWYQPNPGVSLEIIESLGVPEDAAVIDVGGGDSHLCEFLLELGYRDITVLDISRNAIERAQNRLEELAERVKWVIGDVTEYHHERQFDLWHDRATFHFMRGVSDVEKYVAIAARTVKAGGHLIVGTFSERGPEFCSGIPVTRYSIKKLANTFLPYFTLIEGQNLDHVTPAGIKQNYTFCSFERNN